VTAPPATGRSDQKVRGGLRGRWSRRAVLRRPLSWFAWVTLALYVLVLVIGPVVVAADPLAQNAAPLLSFGSPGHLLGTDDLGRDELARLLAGGRPLLIVSVASALGAGVIGTGLGMLAGYRGGAVGAAVMWTMDVLLAFPIVLVAILMVAVLGGGTGNAIVAIGLSQMPYFARLTRNLTVAERDRDYVRSARALGYPGVVIGAKEILPNLSGQLLVQATSTLAVTAGLSSALSYLGLGQDAATPDWGYMVKAGQEFIFSYPLLCLVPGLLITGFAVACNLVGDDLRDAMAGGGRA
jgi:ABC-type dipeptide/oligopeptide/nickel transport system permease subunit